jgi:cell division protein FtsI (penicillin-binding protein 3)
MNIKTNILFRIYIVIGCIILFAVAILGKALHVQTYKNGYWKNISDSLNTRTFAIPAERGNIFSADDRLLATSLPFFNLHIDFGSDAMSKELFEKNIDSLAFLAALTFDDKSKATYRKEFSIARNNKRRYYLLQSKVDFFVLQKVKKWPLLREGKFKGGLIIETEQKRKNPYGILALRTIGYSRKNAEDVGLEEYYNDYLCGREGKILKQKIAGGVWMPIFKENAIEPENGKDIITTIDVNVQDVSEDALYDALRKAHADFGCAIVMETKTGAIKAIANLSKDKDSSYAEKYNHAIGLASEPGSTFKLATYLAMFDDGFINEKDSIMITNGTAKFYGSTIVDDHKVNGYYKIYEAFAMSSNTAVAKLALKYYNNNWSKFWKKLNQFELNEKTNIDIKGEATPLISKSDTWSKLSLPWKAHGYENLITPLQLLTFYNAVANNGYRVKPRLVEKIIDNGAVIKSFEPEISSTPIASQKAISSAKYILQQVVENEHGTAKKIFTKNYKIAGKTGTAKINLPKLGYQNKNQATFCGYFPADNPAYTCIVVIYGPQGMATTGGAIAAPVFRRISDYIMATSPANQSFINISKNKILPTTLPIIANYNTLNEIIKKYKLNASLPEDDNYHIAKISATSLNTKPYSTKEDFVPNVKGFALDDAIYLLENLGLKVSFSGHGKVIEQSIPHGQKFIKGSTIYIQLS